MLELLPYQEEGAKFLAQHSRAGLFDEMGVGKTAQAIAALDMIGADRVLIVCPAAVRAVWAGEFKKFAKRPRRILKAKAIDDLGLWLRGRADVLLLSYEMATKWAPRIEGASDLFDAVVFDECFPAGTLVATEYGEIPIERIVNQKLKTRVWCCGPDGLELRPVTRYIKAEARQGVVKLRHTHGLLTCTPNHKVWVEGRGYDEAHTVRPGDCLRVVQGPLRSEGAGAAVLQQALLCQLAKQAAPLGSRKDEKAACEPKGIAETGRGSTDESFEFKPGISRQTGCYIEVAQRPVVARETRRKRVHNGTSAPSVRSAGLAGNKDGAHHSDSAGEAAVSKPTPGVQSRFGGPGAEAGNRSGWAKSRNEAVAVSGCEKDSRVVLSRVDRVEVQKPRGSARLAVYNIEVEDHHNYIADSVLVGNCHYMKSDEAQRTKALLGPGCNGAAGLARWAAHVWFLTGTPAANDPIDIWPFLRFTGATELGKTAFKKRYFNSRMGSYSIRHTPLDAMVPELRATIRALSLRRTKEEAGLLLPPIWLTTQSVDGDTAEIRALLREHPGMEKAVLEAVEKGGLSFLDAQHIATLRRLVGEAKAPAFTELLIEELQNGMDKVVVMGLHRRALESVRSGLSQRGFDTVHIDGSVGEADRVAAVDRFQSDPDCRVFVGNIKAAGTGLTLTAAADIIMFESDWSPAGNAQAIMRIHRKGQERECRARFISLADSIDERVSATVAQKTASIAKIGFGMVAA